MRRLVAIVVGFWTGFCIGMATVDSAELQLDGVAAYAVPSHGDRYLALPWGRGVAVTICATERTSRCIERVSNDAGPDLAMQRAGRVADLSFVDFAYLCDCDPRLVGLLDVTITRVGARATLPPTSVETNGANERCRRWPL